MALHYRLRGGLGHAAFEDRTILLDVEADRYWQLPGTAALLLAKAANGDPFCGTEAGLSQLLELGFLVRGQPGDLCQPYASLASIPAPLADLLDDERPQDRPSLVRATQIAWSAIAVRAELRATPLHRLLARIARTQRRGRAGSESELASLAWHYTALCRLLPVRPRCLPDSLALLRLARRQGHDPRLVFGVQPAPFAAHCWLQSGPLVLTDRIGHVRRFTPLLAL
ncbi:lasso peptide biosynthesis B2 protein [Sphingomonas sp. CJ99]